MWTFRHKYLFYMSNSILAPRRAGQNFASKILLNHEIITDYGYHNVWITTYTFKTVSDALILDTNTFTNDVAATPNFSFYVQTLTIFRGLVCPCLLNILIMQASQTACMAANQVWIELKWLCVFALVGMEITHS